MRKRKNGEGSYGKTKIGKYEYYYFKDSSGHTTYAKTDAELTEKLKNGKHKNKIFDKKITVGDYVKDWLYNKKYQEVGSTIQATTFDAYEDGLNLRFFKYKEYPLALRQLHILSLNILNDYLKSLAQKYSRKSIQKTWEVLRMCFTDEEYKNYYMLPKLNYRSVKLPTESNVAVKKKDVSFTSNTDMDILYQESKKRNPHSGHSYGNAAKMIVFIMYSGLRVAEACGLKWKNVNLENETITISETYSTIKTRDEDGNATGYQKTSKAPKTENSTTTIPYRERAGEILKELNEQYPDHLPDDYVFVTDKGVPYTRRSVEKTLNRMANNAGLKDKGYTVHSLRHGYGSILYQEGIDIKTISTLLRHADIQTTANIYVKPTNNTLKAALKKIDKTQHNA